MSKTLDNPKNQHSEICKPQDQSFRASATEYRGEVQPLEDGAIGQTLNHRWLETSVNNIIQEALELWPDLLITSGFNLNGVVLIDQAVKAGYRGKVVFVDTGYHFAETLALRDELQLIYSELDFVTLNANLPDNREYATNPDDCCFKRKIKPLKDYLAKQQPSALLSGRNRDGAETRHDLQPFEAGNPIKVNPLFNNSREELEAYAKKHGLKLNNLYERGYLSIGCAPCTRAVLPGEHVRAGRWPEREKTECGLWWGKLAL